MAHLDTDEKLASLSGGWEWVYRQWFDTSHRHGLGQYVERGVAYLIMLNVILMVLEHGQLMYSGYEVYFRVLDGLFVAVFTFEYVLRVGASAHDPKYQGRSMPRWRYMMSPYALIDFIAIVPFYLMVFLPFNVDALRVIRVLRLIRIFKLGRYILVAWDDFQYMNQHRSFRGKVHALLEPTGHSGRLRVYVDNFIVFWVLVSIVSVVLESVSSVRLVFEYEFMVIDHIAFWIFIIEYAARLYCAPEHPKFHRIRWPRWAFASNGQAVIDLLAILPFLLEYVVSSGLDLRFLRVFRLMRLLKLTRYTSAMSTLYKVVRREWQVIFASVFVMLLLVVLTASMGYLFEHGAQPEKFENIPQSIYWAVVTLASVGYGDISPVTPMGRALTVVLAFLGIGIFAIPAGLLASAFTDQLRIDREAFKHRLLKAYHQGTWDPHAQDWLAQETERLHLSSEDIARITEEAKHEVESRQVRPQDVGPAMLIDPRIQPGCALQQYRLLVSQLRLLQQAAGTSALEQQIGREHPDDAVWVRKVLQALETDSSDLFSDRNDGGFQR